MKTVFLKICFGKWLLQVATSATAWKKISCGNEFVIRTSGFVIVPGYVGHWRDAATSGTSGRSRTTPKSIFIAGNDHSIGDIKSDVSINNDHSSQSAKAGRLQWQSRPPFAASGVVEIIVERRKWVQREIGEPPRRIGDVSLDKWNVNKEVDRNDDKGGAQRRRRHGRQNDGGWGIRSSQSQKVKAFFSNVG